MSLANRKAFQTFLNQRGAGLDVDGAIGRQTKAAAMRLFSNPDAPEITAEELARIASSLGAARKQLEAFAQVESNGGGFLRSGHPKILWERHYFWRRIRVKIPLISDPKPGGYTLDANRNGVNDSWEKLLAGCERDPVAAFESASWGKFQIMGAHWKALGYSSVFDFAWSMRVSEIGHYRAFAAFIRVNGLAPLLRKVSTNPADNVPLVRRYNGAGFAKNNYHVKLARAMR
jgi:hypothetical protein